MNACITSWSAATTDNPMPTGATASGMDKRKWAEDGLPSRTHSVVDVSTADVQAWIAADPYAPDVEYAYGGTRSMPFGSDDSVVETELRRLKVEESGLKNSLINRALGEMELPVEIRRRLPSGYLQSRVGGARCILRPKNQAAADALSDPGHPNFASIVEPALRAIGEELNGLQGAVKLTPDFGAFAGVSDMLHQFTEHVLGVACEAGGCGGKASYTVTGIAAAVDLIGVAAYGPKTVIGADGALGRGMVEWLDNGQAPGVADLHYDAGRATPPSAAELLPAMPGMFTEACLERGGTIVATTVGHELENSAWQSIPAGTRLFLAHNLALPHGEEGVKLARALARRHVLVIPGQMLTLGGALTSRLEWFHRQATGNAVFGPDMKQLAHEIVGRLCRFLAERVMTLANERGQTPYEAMLEYARGDY